MSNTPLYDELASACAGITLLRDEPMSRHTTFEIGGPADVLAQPKSADEVAALLRVCRALDIPYRILGAGSDVLVADEGLRCVVIEIGAAMAEVRVEGTDVIAQAGATNKQVAEAACAAGLSGYEFASGIPGTIGGAAFMNAGAYDGEFSQVCIYVECLTPEGEAKRLYADECEFAYRHSIFEREGLTAVGACLGLWRENPATVRALMDDLEQRRAEKQPLELPSAGSTFKRPEGYYVGQLVQEAGLQGFSVGGAQVSEKHAGFVVNTGGATAADVRAVIAHVQDVICARTGVQLQPEVRFWD